MSHAPSALAAPSDRARLFGRIHAGVSLGSTPKRDGCLGSQPEPIPEWGSSERGGPRHLSWSFLRNPSRLEKQEQETLSLIRQEKNVDLVYGLAQRFVSMVKERKAALLFAWLRDCRMSGITELVNFAQGLENDGSALHAALTLSYSNGPVEGKINKLKYIKRSMYGRAGFPLLRQRF